MDLISLFDPSICSSNLGDQIIMDAVNREVAELFPRSLVVRFPTHDVISKNSYRLINQSNYTLIGGTNLLSSRLNSHVQWRTSLLDTLFIKDILLMGVGWWQYQGLPNAYSKLFYKRFLNKKGLHSVRDSYTEQQLKAIGFHNVLNTACPTMWELTDEHCVQIPTQKSNSVLVTLTEYNQQPELDRPFIETLFEEYEQVYYWVQQPKDYPYMKEICGEKAIYVEPSVSALNRAFSTVECDYIGTRLHAGIRALQHKRRTLILAIDNRAAEISKDTGLPVVQRNDLSGVKTWINQAAPTRIRLPWENIRRWKAQFGK